ncbi:MAG: DNA repair protein RecO [Candidatus Obscuribacterales bacterium]|nr:DNA repair protein RecO [Candidatus Obscuribacterales bacterium]
MPTYTVKAINVGSFDLGEADKVLSIFSAEKGLLKAVAKSVKKPGTKMAGRADILSVNELLLASGRTFEIISQAQTLETFPGLRADFTRLSYGLHYAELTQILATGLEEESNAYFSFLVDSLRLQATAASCPLWLCLEFEMGLLQYLGYTPELTCCIVCRTVLTDYNLSRFNVDLGGVICSACFGQGRKRGVREQDDDADALARGIHISPLVWKNLVLASMRKGDSQNESPAPHITASRVAAKRLMHNYLEHRCGRRLKSLDVLAQISQVSPA